MLEVRYFSTSGKGWPHANGNLGIPASVFLEGNATLIDLFPYTFDSVHILIDGRAQTAKEAWVENNVLIIANGTSLAKNTPVVVIFSIAEK
jgi:hypothetical protein